MAEKDPCDCSDYEYDLKDCNKELEKTKEKLTSLREEKFLVCEQAKEQADEKIDMLKKQLTRWTIGGSVAATVVGKEAVEEITATIQGVEEAVNTIVPGAIPGVGSMIPGGGGAGGPTPMTMPDGSTMFWDPSMGWMNGSAGFFGGAGGMGMGSSNNVANQNPEKAKPQTEDEEEQEEEEEAKKKKKEEEEEEAEEEEEESEEESEDEESEESEDEEDSEDAEEEEEAKPAEMEEEEEADQNEEDSTEDSENQEQSEEQSSEQASNDSPQIFGLPSPELFVENGKIVDITGETLSEYVANLGAVAQVWNIPETPNLIESIPAILNSRQPQSGEVIVGDYETNDPQPPQTIDEPEVIVIPEEDVYVPESPITDPPYDPPILPMQQAGIPEPGILLALFIPYIWQIITKRRRKK